MHRNSVIYLTTLILLALVLYEYVSYYCVIVLFLVTGIVLPETCVRKRFGSVHEPVRTEKLKTFINVRITYI